MFLFISISEAEYHCVLLHVYQKYRSCSTFISITEAEYRCVLFYAYQHYQSLLPPRFIIHWSALPKLSTTMFYSIFVLGLILWSCERFTQITIVLKCPFAYDRV